MVPFKRMGRSGLFQVRSEANRILAELIAWSLRASSSGVAPTQGFYGESFHPKSTRGLLQGKQLARGWKLLKIKFSLPFSIDERSKIRLFIACLLEHEELLCCLQGGLESKSANAHVPAQLSVQVDSQ